MKTASQQVLPTHCDVAIIGAGPAGLAAATQLKQLGVSKLVVLERESEAGGIPRHCGHPGFGMREFKRIMSGPNYARALVARARQAGVEIYTNTTAVQCRALGQLLLTSPQGSALLTASVVLLATGTRETPRAARLISGQRPLGITTTGALQSMVYLKKKLPFRNPVIVGSELVSFSALLTCRHAGIKPVAMLEANKRITARAFARILPLALGVELCLDTEIVEILGKDRVSGVRVRHAHQGEKVLACDGVVFSGRFIPESALMRQGHIAVDAASGGPLVDQFGRCSDPHYFATGNLLRPVESAAWCWREGIAAAQAIAHSLTFQLPAASRHINLLATNPVIKYRMPQRLSLPCADQPAISIQLRFRRAAKGRLTLRAGDDILWSKAVSSLPERRLLIPVPSRWAELSVQDIEIDFEEH